MKLIFVFILFFLGQIFSQKETGSLNLQPDKHLTDTILEGFRGIIWESPSEEVRLKEKTKFMQRSEGWGISTISYSGEIADFPARIDYSFKDNKLIEGSYSIKHRDIYLDFHQCFDRIKNFLSNVFGSPNYKVANDFDTDSIWIKVNPYGLFKGPQYFWQFLNGFICIHSSKFAEEITITVLYVFDTKIDEYYDDRLIPLN